MTSESMEGRYLVDLKVTELKLELEKRGKDKNGIKSALIARLSEALEEEGLDPAAHKFVMSSTPKKAISRDNNGNEQDEHVKAENGSFPGDQRDSHDHNKEYAANDGEMDYDGLADVDDKETNEVSSTAAGQSSSPVDASSAKTFSSQDSALKPRNPADEQDSLIVHVDDTRDLDIEDVDSSMAAPSATVSQSSKRESSSSRKEKSTSSSSASSKKKESKEKSDRGNRDDKDSSSKKESSSASKPKGDSSSKEAKSSTDVEASKSSGSKEEKGGDVSDRNVWVAGITGRSKASDLKAIFEKHGKVVGAKIITNTKIPGSRFFGLITMETAEQAAECIKGLNKTRMDGRTISLTKERPTDSESSSKKDSKSEDRRDKSRDVKRGDRKRSPRRNRSPIRRPGGRPLNPRLGPPSRPGKVFVPSRDRIMTPAELRRIENERLARRRERITRENEERRRHDSERRQRDDLEREKEKLRIERERLEKEKAELIRLERERARLEREKIEREKDELRRRLQREEQEMRRPMAPSGAPIGPGIMKRPYESRDADVYWDDSRKRQIIGHAVAADSLSSGLSSRLGPYDPLGAAGLSATDARYDSYAARAAATLASDTRYSGYATAAAVTESRTTSGSNARHGSDRDDRGRGGLSSSSTSGSSSFYRTDLRSTGDSRDSRSRGNNGSGNSRSDDRRDTRPASAVTSMMSSVAAVGPGMYASSAAPLGPSSLMTHSSLSSSSLGPSSLERGYRRF